MKNSSLTIVLPIKGGSSAFFCVFAFVLLLGCGHPATEEECREILRRTAELELAGRLNDKALIQAELKEIEVSMHEPMMQKCVGKRLTKSALACVREATSSEELSRECFR